MWKWQPEDIRSKLWVYYADKNIYPLVILCKDGANGRVFSLFDGADFIVEDVSPIVMIDELKKHGLTPQESDQQRLLIKRVHGVPNSDFG